MTHSADHNSATHSGRQYVASDVRPLFPPHDLADRLRTDSIEGGQPAKRGASRPVPGANLQHLLPGQASTPVAFATHPCCPDGGGVPLAPGLPTPSHHIGGVLCSSALPQVSGVAAGWIVASVQYLQGWIDRVVRDLKRHAMGADNLRSPFSTKSELTVPVATRRGPRPAGIWAARTVYFCPKTGKLAQGILVGHLNLLSRSDVWPRCCRKRHRGFALPGV